MQKELFYGLVAGSTIATVMSLISPNQVGMVIAGGSAGATGAAITTQQQERRFKKKLAQVQTHQETFEQRLQASQSRNQQIQKERDTLQQQLRTAQADIKEIRQHLKPPVKHSDRPVAPSRSAPLASAPLASPVQPLPNPATPPSGRILGAALEAVPGALPEAVSEKLSPAVAWLRAHQVEVLPRQPKFETDAAVESIFEEVAVHLGKHYEVLAPLYRKIRGTISSGTPFTFRLERHQASINTITTFCDHLHRTTLLADYRYVKTTSLIHATPQSRGDMINFFNGLWFEKFIYRQVTDLLKQRGLNYSALVNPHIVFANGNRFELDLFFVVEGEPLLIECKAGRDYNAHLQKYSQHSQLLSLPKSSAILVILDIPEKQANEVMQMWSALTVTNQNNLLAAIEQAVEHLIPADEPAQSKVIDLAPKGAMTEANLLALLNRKNLRPAPEYRQAIIRDLIAVFTAAQQPISLADIKQTIVSHCANSADLADCSKTKIEGVLRAIRLSGCLLNETNQPLFSTCEPIASLLSSDPAVLERKCVENYALAVLMTHPQFFENVRNRKIFERVVAAQTPDEATRSALKRRLQLDPPDERTESIQENG